MTRLRGTFAAVALVLTAAAAAPAKQYRSYANPRFGTTADVPAHWRADLPPDNDDGLVFRSPDRRARYREATTTFVDG